MDFRTLEYQEKLKLPGYNGMDTVLYLFSWGVSPDMLTIREWSAEDMGNTEAEEKKVTTFNYPVSFVELKPGCIYEFTPVWKEENLEKNGFYGDADYVVMTE